MSSWKSMRNRPLKVWWSEDDKCWVAIVENRPLVSGLGATPIEAIMELGFSCRMLEDC